MNQKNSLSAIIIAKNEATRIGACIDALSFCSEVFVADNGSTDETVAVAKKHGAVVGLFHCTSFAALRNEASKKVTGDWILYVDADETVGKDLADAILQCIGSWDGDKPTSYCLNRVNYYLGTRWPKGEWMLRLFKRTALQGWSGDIHETAQTSGAVGRISDELKHDTHRSLEEMIVKTNEWSEMEARLRLEAHHPRISWWRLLRVSFTGFFHSFVTEGGWRAGTVGWIESMYQGFSLFITYAKLWEMQQK